MKCKTNFKIVSKVSMIISFIAISLLVASITEVVATENKTFEWRLSHWASGPTGHAKFSVDFAEKITKRSNGQIKVKIFWMNELNGPREMMMAVKSRLADVVCAVPAYTPGQTPIWNATWLPFLAPAQADLGALIYNRLANESQPFKDELNRFNCIYAGGFDTEQYNFIGKKPVRTVADLKGLRVRVMSLLGEVLKKFGAVPVTVSASEMYSALNTGIVDVVAQNRWAFHAYKLDEMSDYITFDIDMGGGAGMHLINREAWNELPDNLKEVVRSVAAESPIEAWNYAHDPIKIKNAEEGIKKRGIEIIRFPRTERDKLIDAAKDLWEIWAKRSGNYTAAKQGLADYIRIRDEVVAQYPNGVPGIKKK